MAKLGDNGHRSFLNLPTGVEKFDYENCDYKENLVFAKSGIKFIDPSITLMTQFLFQVILTMFVWARDQFTKTDARTIKIMKYITVIMVIEITLTVLFNEIKAF